MPNTTTTAKPQRVRINAESAALILDRWDAVRDRLRKQSAWVTLLRLAAANDWTSITDIGQSGGPKQRASLANLLRSWVKDGLVETAVRNDKRVHGGRFAVYRITDAGLQLLNAR